MPGTSEEVPALPVVLLVDDHLDTRQMYAEFLRSRFEVVTAGDGREALEMMEAGPRPDLVITDLSMPRLDGIELLVLMRQNVGLQTVPVICLSGYGTRADEQRAQAAGCARILKKPCMPDALADAAEDVLRTSLDRGRPS